MRRIFTTVNSGQGLVEFGLILALMAIAAIGSLTLLGGNTSNLIANMIEGGGGGGNVAVVNTGNPGGGPAGGGPAGGGTTTGNPGTADGTTGGLDLNGDGLPDNLGSTDSIVPIYDANGNITGYEVTGTAEDGSQVTSVVGNGEMLLTMGNQMMELANNPTLTTADGQSLVPDLTSFAYAYNTLTQATAMRDANLAQINALSDMFNAQGPLPDPNSTGPQTYPPEMVEGVLAITQSYIQMSTMYDTVRTQIDNLAITNPDAHAQVAAEFNMLADTASSLTMTQTLPDVLSGLQMSRIDQSNLTSMAGKYGDAVGMIAKVSAETHLTVGLPPQTTDPVALTNYYNDVNSAFIGNTQNTVGGYAFGDVTTVASTIYPAGNITANGGW